MQHYSKLLENIASLDFEIVTNNKKISYYNVEAGFDIETTSMMDNGEKVAFSYIWMIGIGYGNPVYYGRTWDEFVTVCDQLAKHFQLAEDLRLIVYVHNLAYEFQFMRKYFEWLDIFAIDDRKPLYAVTNQGIEFRDSYLLSGYNLANTAKNLTKYKVKKLVGDLDYSLIRHHETPLTDAEMGYCENDIVIILAYIKEQIYQYDGEIINIPLTNTGRVRNYVRDNCYTLRNGKKNAFLSKHGKLMRNLVMDYPTYKQLRGTFMGGFTHANANYAGETLRDVHSVDFTSSYPSVMLAEKFPMSKFKPIQYKSMDEFRTAINSKAVIMVLHLENVTPKFHHEHYISLDKCIKIKNEIVDNGRIVSADYLEIMITEVDFKIIEKCYSWGKMSLSQTKEAFKAYLPAEILKPIIQLYQDKTQLKDVKGAEVEYLLSKGMLNSVYGMCVTDPVKDEHNYRHDNWFVDPVNGLVELDEHNKSMNRFLYYAWGIYVTAYARQNLWTGIFAIGEDYVYSDTDSLKMLNYSKHEEYINRFNNWITGRIQYMCVTHLKIDPQVLSPKTKEGISKPIGIWDYEGHYTLFKTLGAKRYLYEHNGKLTLTVAGLSKRNGIEYLLNQCGGDHIKVFELFNNNLHVPAEHTGKMTHTYIDSEMSLLVTDYQGNCAEVYTPSGIHLEGVEFTMTISDAYKSFLTMLNKGYLFTGIIR